MAQKQGFRDLKAIFYSFLNFVFQKDKKKKEKNDGVGITRAPPKEKVFNIDQNAPNEKTLTIKSQHNSGESSNSDIFFFILENIYVVPFNFFIFLFLSLFCLFIINKRFGSSSCN